MIFTLNSYHWMSQAFLIQQNIDWSVWVICSAAFLFTFFAFLCSLLSSIKNEYIFGFNPTSSSLATSPVLSFILPTHCMKSVQTRVFYGPYFPVFGLNTEIYGVNLRIQSEYRKIRPSKNSAFGHFSSSGCFLRLLYLVSFIGSLSIVLSPKNVIY